MPKIYVAIASMCTVLIALTVGVVFVATNNAMPANDVSKHSVSLVNGETLGSFDKESNSLISTTHVAKGLTPPTNKWYSPMVLNDEPKPGFNVPNSILPLNDGFGLGLPKITASGDGIYGPHMDGIRLTAKNAKTFELTRYDELTITLTYYNTSGSELFDVTFASGSPYGFVLAKQDVEVTILSGSIQNESKGLTTFKNGDVWYGAKTSNGQAGSNVRLQKNDELAVFSAVKQTDIAMLARAAQYPIVSGQATYELLDDKVKTTLSYKTNNNNQTILVRMPHQSNSGRSISSYSSIYGSLSAYKSSKIEYTQSRKQFERSLSLNDISASERVALVAQLKTDIAGSKLDKNDTYFGGKQLQRLAHLVTVADSLSETELRDEALGKLTPAIAAWFDPDKSKSFYYDETGKTMVGREASFGSDKELNDHHFHYGYFIYAASVAAKFDKEFLGKYKDDINILVADIANYKINEALPLRRNFDAYSGHSWASGMANYGYGNNQESSSEAVNAWTGMGLWADVTGNNALQGEADWLLANEVAAAKAYWLSQPKNTGYTYPLVSINWGGKREYKTFFSDEPNAKLAIQLLPLNPTMKSYVSTLPESIFEGADVNKQYGDYILMAEGSKGSFKAARNYPGSLIDDGNSKAYMMAYVLSK